MLIEGVSGKTVYLLGLDSTGLANATFLEKQECTLYGWDDDEKHRKHAPNAVKLLPPEEMDWAEVDAILESLNTPLHVAIIAQAQEAGVSVWSALDILQKAAPEATYIAITGTSGKSTAVSLIAHLLREAGFKAEVGGHIGRPALGMPLLEKGAFYVLEVSSVQLLSMQTFRANIAVLLNISPDHMDVHKTMEAYIAAKKRIFNNQTPADLRVLSVDNYELEHMGISLGLNVPLRRISVTGVGADISVTVDGRLLDYDAIPARFIVNLNGVEQLKGLHHWQNITCAWAAVKGLMTQEQFMAGLDSFKGLRHRFQRVVEKDNVLFVNDSKATTGPAAARALENTEHPFWIAGGEAREGGIEACLAYLDKLEGVYLIGDATELFATTLKEAGFTGHVEACGTLECAAKKAYEAAKKFVKIHQNQENQATVLLSPACNSFDQFDSFEHRGQMFIDLAYSLTKTAPTEAN